MEHFQQWAVRHRVPSADYGVTHYESIMRMLDFGASWDQLDVCNAAGIETAFRQAQPYEYTYAMDRRAYLDSGGNGAASEEGGAEGDARMRKGRGRGLGADRALIRIGVGDDAEWFAVTSRGMG